MTFKISKLCISSPKFTIYFSNQDISSPKPTYKMKKEKRKKIPKIVEFFIVLISFDQSSKKLATQPPWCTMVLRLVSYATLNVWYVMA